MNKEPLEAQSVEVWTLDQLFEISLDAFREHLGLPPKPLVIDANPEQVVDTNKPTKDAQTTGETN